MKITRKAIKGIEGDGVCVDGVLVGTAGHSDEAGGWLALRGSERPPGTVAWTGESETFASESDAVAWLAKAAKVAYRIKCTAHNATVPGNRPTYKYRAIFDIGGHELEAERWWDTEEDAERRARSIADRLATGGTVTIG